MCVIIDANVAHRVVNPDEDSRPLLDWWQNPKKLNKVAIGGKLREELSRAGSDFNRLLKTYVQAGRVCSYDDGEVDAETKQVARELHDADIAADDPHVIALARVSGARVLFSHDKKSNLHRAFRDRRFVSQPRGYVYQTAKHVHLLKRACACKPPARSS